MRKLRRDNELDQNIHRSILEAYNKDGVVAARKVYKEQTGHTNDKVKMYIDELVKFLEEIDKKKISKGCCNVDNLMFLLTMTEEEEQELERQSTKYEIRYIWGKTQESIKEAKRVALKDIQRLKEELDSLAKRIEASENEPGFSFYNPRLSSRANEIDEGISKLGVQATQYQELKHVFTSIDKLTGINVIEKSE